MTDKKMTLAEYLAGMQAATTAQELEAAIQAPHKHSFRGPTWSRICTIRIAAGNAICDRHEHGRFVPRFGPRRQLSVCGETCRVGSGQNSTGVRYVWHYAEQWAIGVLRANGLSQRAAHQVWDEWGEYPHRCLSTLEKAFAGEIPDPELNTLIYHERDGGSPIRYTVEQNDADRGDHRAARPCRCGGTLFDWGAGSSEGFDFVNWHCNVCPSVATEYFGPDGVRELRTNARLKLEARNPT